MPRPRPQSPLQPSAQPNRVTADPFGRNAQNVRVQQSAPAFQQLPRTPSPAFTHNVSSGSRPLLPGVLLRGGRYRLQALIERQDWLAGVFEATWIGRDSQRGGAQVSICEVVLPENNSVMTQSILRTATMALASVGRHPRIPTLWDAFSDQGRSFFVFEPIEGESLLARLRHSGRPLPEQEVIECCLQMTEVLELLAQQSPQLVHGLIRPEHIIVGRSGTQYFLTNFSIILAGGATQFVTGIERSRLSPYAAPEFARGVIDVRTDLYSLIASAYHSATGSVPTGISGSVPQAQRLNSAISSEFDAILTKGLRAVANQRYQRPSELRQDLLALRSVSGTLVSRNGTAAPEVGTLIADRDVPPLMSGNGQRAAQSMQRGMESVAQQLPIKMIPPDAEEDRVLLLPRPEELPPMKRGNDTLVGTLLFSAILLSLILVVVLSHFLG